MTEGRKDTLVAVAKKLMGRCWRPPPADWLSTFYLCSACKHLERRDVLLLLLDPGGAEGAGSLGALVQSRNKKLRESPSFLQL